MDSNKPKKEDRRVKYTKQAIRDGFLRLIARKPIEKITVTEICREADINRGTFYAHYSDPYELKRSVENELTEAMEQRVRELGTPRMTTLQMMHLLKEHQELCRVFAGPYGDNDALLRIIAKQADEYIVHELETLGKLSDTTRECIKGLLVSSISTAVKYWFDTDMQAPPERVAYVLETYCSHGTHGFLDGSGM